MTHETKPTGELIFLWYAFPCAEDLAMSGRRSELHFKELKHYIETRDSPRRRLLKHYFRNAFRALSNFAREQNRAIWSVETVSEFWRHHHGHEGDCAVLSCIVTQQDGLKVVVSSSERKPFVVINLYDNPLKIGTHVFVHRRVICEVTA